MARKKMTLQARIEYFNATHRKTMRELVKMYRQGMTFKTMSVSSGMSPQTISNDLVRLGRITEADRIEHARNSNEQRASWRRQ